jgi:dTDP-4-dehydrorhamnose reductase
MKILVTGADGQLGSEIPEAMSKHGHEVVARGLDGLDITDAQSVQETISGLKPDVVINCASYNDVDGAEADLQNALLVNGTAVGYLANACNACGAVLVHFSTDYVFDGTEGKPYAVSDDPKPINKYGESKLLGEKLLGEFDGKHLLIRTSWVFGEGKNSFPMKVLKWAADSRKLRIVDDQVSSPTYVADLAAAVEDLLEKGVSGTYHVTNSGECSRYDWAELVLKETGWDGGLERARSEDFATPARRPKYSVLDNSLFEKAVGYLLPPWQDATKRFLKRMGKTLKDV